ncbi:carboxyl transferase domain-containing protein [Streptomyces sp. WMMB 322]|uniref:carboxyl transferase domain-containing protein n=1 Tax=Streptomyces sp. WMMB 322 TaxID=1286821 RepID=UPI000823F91E|nr:carboxyl transferase domain-containing protein [Streptomyces sp. WMMB 322]SCK22434.1 acetyl-CoA carboxylase carboxyl transferase subunit beta [Streptomyces sp. WMMB 322]
MTDTPREGREPGGGPGRETGAESGGRLGSSARAAIRAVASGFSEFESPVPGAAGPGGREEPDGPLDWRGYGAARERARERTGESESVVCGTARIGGGAADENRDGGEGGKGGEGGEGGEGDGEDSAAGAEAVLISFEFGYLGGSLGAHTGDSIAAAYAHARAHRLPLVSLIATGGSRMQEGMVALSQLQRVARESVLARRAGVPQLAVLRDPATGGGWATLGAGADVVLALPGAQVAFAGSRVRPGGADPAAYTAEGQHAAGHVDQIVEETRLAVALERWLTLLTGGGGGPAPPPRALPSRTPSSRTPTHAATPGPQSPGTAGAPQTSRTQEEVSQPPQPPQALPAGASSAGPGRRDAQAVPLSGQEAVARARTVRRPRAAAYLDDYFDWREEVRGDRCGGVDAGMLCGFGRRGGRTIAYAAQTGTATRPAGFRTAARLIRTADRLGIPVLTLIDTPGAANDAEAESAGAGPAIAEVFAAVAEAAVPVTSLLIGEGGSGGALALAAPGRLWVTPDSYFSVIAPELAAAILKRPEQEAAATADELMLRPQDVVRLGVARAVVGPRDGASQSDAA